jgi:hypothetical protein
VYGLNFEVANNYAALKNNEERIGPGPSGFWSVFSRNQAI